MDVVEEFRFKLAKAKDLPPTWFELILLPNKFQDHVTALHTNRKLEPSALSLIAVFLEKAGYLEGQSTVEVGISQERKDVLINCAQFMAAFLEWDLLLMEKGLPPAVIYSLLNSLIITYPLSSSCSLSTVAPITTTAHILYHLWIIRFISQCHTLSSKGLRWDGTCANIETIKQLVLPHTSTAISFLLEACNLYNNFQIPSTHLTLAKGYSGSTVSISLPSSLSTFSWKDLHAQMHFDVGQFLFDQEDYNSSQKCFQSCLQLLHKCSSCPPYPSIDRDKLNGYMSACASFDIEREEEEEEELATVNKTITDLEQLRKTNAILEQSSLFPGITKLTDTYRIGLSLDVSDWSVSVAMEPPMSKRCRIEKEELVFAHQFNIWDTICSVIKGRGVPPTALKAITLHNRDTIITIFEVIAIVLRELPHSDKDMYCYRLSLFLKSIHSNSDLWRECEDSYPLVKELLLVKDQYSSIVSEGVSIVSVFPSPVSDPLTRLIPILLSSNSNQMKDSMTCLFQQTSESDHVVIATALRGEGKEFVSVEKVKNPIASAQYNILIQKAESCIRDKDYVLANELYSSAAQFLSSSKSISNPVCHSLIPVLMEHSLRMRILAASKNLKNLSNKLACEKYSALIDEAKSHYSNNRNPNRDISVTTLTGVFLLNLQQYNYVIHCDRLNLHERICSKLAVIAQRIQESQDLRRCTRELFESISGVFTSPAKGVGEDKKHTRKYLEVISNNLQDLVSLSYLIAAITRLWNLVMKPEFDITIEYTGHWPTAIGHASSIDPDIVLRALKSLLTHSLNVLPSYSLWLIIQGDIYLTTNDYSSALRCYLEGGAHESDLFESEVPESVWSKQVYHRMIICCLKLHYHTHALIMCQLIEPLNYSFTVSLLKDNIQHLLEDMFEYLWDMSVIEVLIYTLNKQGDITKRTSAIQVASQPEVNIHNPKDTLAQAKAVRRRTFLRTLYQTIINSVYSK